MARGEIELSKLIKRFTEVTAVDGIDLHIPGGEFFLLGLPAAEDDHSANDRRLRATDFR
jgi:hypothetical protein